MFNTLNNGYLRQNQQFRAALEREAAILAARKCTPLDAAELWVILARLDAAEDEKVRGELDRELHKKIAKIADNPMVYSVLAAAGQLTESIVSGTRDYIMKKNNSKKWIKTITITTAVLVFAAGAVFALKSAGTANTDKDSADTVVAAANEATDLVVKETVSEKETEVITETAATEATTEEATEAVTEQSSTIAEIQPQTEVATEAVQEPEVTELPVVQTPSDARVAQVIAGINAEREAAGVAAVTYDVTLTDMAQVRASENAANDYFVIENGKHKRPDGRKASSICEDYGQSGNFGEVMGRYQGNS